MKALIVSDIHANLAALEAVLAQERDSDEVIFLGDAIGSGPQPEEVLQALSCLEGVRIMGNHDVHALGDGHGATDAATHYRSWARAQISKPMKRFVGGFEPPRTIERDGVLIRLHHGCFPKPIGRLAKRASSRWLRRLKRVRLLGRIRGHLARRIWDNRVWPDSSPEVFEAISDVYRESFVFLAHSHVQFRRVVNGVTFINPGSVGQPRLGQPLATYAVLQDGRIDLKATPYDVEATCRALEKAPLSRAELAAWQAAYRGGRLPERYRMRDLRPLVDQGYR